MALGGAPRRTTTGRAPATRRATPSAPTLTVNNNDLQQGPSSMQISQTPDGVSITHGTGDKPNVIINVQNAPKRTRVAKTETAGKRPIADPTAPASPATAGKTEAQIDSEASIAAAAAEHFGKSPEQMSKDFCFTPSKTPTAAPVGSNDNQPPTPTQVPPTVGTAGTTPAEPKKDLFGGIRSWWANREIRKAQLEHEKALATTANAQDRLDQARTTVAAAERDMAGANARTVEAAKGLNGVLQAKAAREAAIQQATPEKHRSFMQRRLDAYRKLSPWKKIAIGTLCTAGALGAGAVGAPWIAMGFFALGRATSALGTFAAVDGLLQKRIKSESLRWATAGVGAGAMAILFPRAVHLLNEKFSLGEHIGKALGTARQYVPGLQAVEDRIGNAVNSTKDYIAGQHIGERVGHAVDDAKRFISEHPFISSASGAVGGMAGDMAGPIDLSGVTTTFNPDAELTSWGGGGGTGGGVGGGAGGSGLVGGTPAANPGIGFPDGGRVDGGFRDIAGSGSGETPIPGSDAKFNSVRSSIAYNGSTDPYSEERMFGKPGGASGTEPFASVENPNTGADPYTEERVFGKPSGGTAISHGPYDKLGDPLTPNKIPAVENPNAGDPTTPKMGDQWNQETTKGVTPENSYAAGAHPGIAHDITVARGDNLNKILDAQLKHDPSYSNLKPEAMTNARENLIAKLKGLSPDDLKKLGFASGDINKLRPGDVLHLDTLNTDVDHVLNRAHNLSAGAMQNIGNYHAPEVPAHEAVIDNGTWDTPETPHTATLATDAQTNAWLKANVIKGDLHNMDAFNSNSLDRPFWKELQGMTAKDIIDYPAKNITSGPFRARIHELQPETFVELQKILKGFADKTGMNAATIKVGELIRAGIASK